MNLKNVVISETKSVISSKIDGETMDIIKTQYNRLDIDGIKALGDLVMAISMVDGFTDDISNKLADLGRKIKEL